MSALLNQLASMQQRSTKVKLSDMREDSIIIVKGGFGLEAPVKAIVEELDREGKNGRSTVSYKEIESGDCRWAYLDQIVRVVQY